MTGAIPAPAISGWRWFQTVNQRPRHCIGWSKFWINRRARITMPAIERVIPLVGHLPAAIRDALARRLRELVGLGLIALSGVAAASLMTWSVQDPSLSHATSRAIRNIVGYPGAIGADLLMQILGLGAIMLILPVADRGRQMADQGNDTFDRWHAHGALRL